MVQNYGFIEAGVVHIFHSSVRRMIMSVKIDITDHDQILRDLTAIAGISSTCGVNRRHSANNTRISLFIIKMGLKG
jgi:hypothetical protein